MIGLASDDRYPNHTISVIIEGVTSAMQFSHSTETMFIVKNGVHDKTKTAKIIPRTFEAFSSLVLRLFDMMDPIFPAHAP